MNDLRADLETILEPGIATDPLDHSRQIAAISAILHCAFENADLTATLVGGAAIEIHAPGAFASGDIDLVIEAVHSTGVRDRAAQVFAELGFEKSGRHWTKGDLFVEVPSHSLTNRAEIVQVGSFVFRVIVKEALLVDRVSGFVNWATTSYGQQAIDMMAAFGDDLDMKTLAEGLKREHATQAFESLRQLAVSQQPVTEDTLQDLLAKLKSDGDETPDMVDS